MQAIVIVIERQTGRNVVRVTVGQQVMFSADHVSEETLVAVVRCVSEHWIEKTGPGMEG